MTLQELGMLIIGVLFIVYFIGIAIDHDDPFS